MERDEKLRAAKEKVSEFLLVSVNGEFVMNVHLKISKWKTILLFVSSRNSRLKKDLKVEPRPG